MKNYRFKTKELTLEALIEEIKCSPYFDWDSIDCIGGWLSDFLRNEEDDLGYLNVAISNIGCETSAIKWWFFNQYMQIEQWENNDAELVERWYDALSE